VILPTKKKTNRPSAEESLPPKQKTTMRQVLWLVALASLAVISVSASSNKDALYTPEVDEPAYLNDVFKYVDAEKAVNVELELGENKPNMRHYWHKATAYVVEQKQRKFTGRDVDYEFAAFEASYWKGLPYAVQTTTEIYMPQHERLLNWMLYIE
jgi:hypothetical protein